MVDYKIERASLSHLDEVAELWEQLMKIHKELDALFFIDTESDKKSIKKRLKDVSTSEDSLLLVLIVGQKVKGFVTAYDNGIKYHNYNSKQLCEIGDIMIDKEFRSEGFGKLLIEGVKDWAREKGVHGIELNVFAKNVSGMDFFKSVGLKERFEALYIDF